MSTWRMNSLFLLLTIAGLMQGSYTLAQSTAKIETGITLIVPESLSFTGAEELDWAKFEVTPDNNIKTLQSMGNFGVLANRPCQILVQTKGDWTMTDGAEADITIAPGHAGKYTVRPVLAGSFITPAPDGMRFFSVTISGINKQLPFAEWIGNGTLNATINPGVQISLMAAQQGRSMLSAGQRNLVLEFSLIAK